MQVEDLSATLNKREDSHNQAREAREEPKRKAQVAEEKAPLLEEKLPRTTVDEFKARRDFSVATEKLLSKKNHQPL